MNLQVNLQEITTRSMENGVQRQIPGKLFYFNVKIFWCNIFGTSCDRNKVTPKHLSKDLNVFG